MKLLYATFVFCVFSFQICLCQNVGRVRFIMVDHRIILRIPTVNKANLNFIFDTGTRDLLIDSTVAENFHLIDSNSKAIEIPFISGLHSVCKSVNNSSFLNESVFSRLFPRGYAMNLNNLPNKPKIRIDGIIGMTQMLEHYSLNIDFKHKFIEIEESQYRTIDSTIEVCVPMIYSDSGYETSFSKFARGLPCAQIKIWVSGKMISLNGLFDTGYREDILLLTTVPISSLFTKVPNSVVDGNRDNKKAQTYVVNLDSFFIKSYLEKGKINLAAKETDPSRIGSFGSAKYCVLIGVKYLERFSNVVFDYPRRTIYLKKDN